MRTELFKDNDVLMLFDPLMDGIEDPGTKSASWSESSTFIRTTGSRRSPRGDRRSWLRRRTPGLVLGGGYRLERRRASWSPTLVSLHKFSRPVVSVLRARDPGAAARHGSAATGPFPASQRDQRSPPRHHCRFRAAAVPARSPAQSSRSVARALQWSSARTRHPAPRELRQAATLVGTLLGENPEPRQFDLEAPYLRKSTRPVRHDTQQPAPSAKSESVVVSGLPASSRLTMARQP